MLEPILATDCLKQRQAEETPCSDEDRLVALAKTHPQSFEKLYDRYFGRILNYIYRRTMNVATAEEITSNTFFKALRALPKYDHRGKFGAWLYRIAGNEIKLCWRSTRRQPDNDSKWREDYARVRFAANEAATVEDVEEQVHQFARLHAALLRLPERYQTVLALRYFEGMSYEEVADVLENRVGTVKSLIHRGLNRLRRHYDGISATISPKLHYQVREE